MIWWFLAYSPNCAVTTNIKIKTFSSPPKETCTPQGPFTTLPPRSRQGEPALGCRVDGLARRWPFTPGSSLGAAVACAGPSFIPAVAASQPAAWTDCACLCAPVTAFRRFPLWPSWTPLLLRTSTHQALCGRAPTCF